MGPERWQQVEDVFDRAFALADTARAPFLAEACAGDPELQREVESLLVASTGASASIRGVVEGEAGQLATDQRQAKIGLRIGAYRLDSLIGEGGMGAVYLATRADAAFAQQVAIKILPGAVGSPEAVARFRDERQILAALEHPNIVRLLDGGSTEDDLPYLVMEHIEGATITAHARSKSLAIRARIELVREVCGAIRHAHQNLVIHRDIKPSNILVDGAGRPKLLDFGIAKLLAPVSEFEREARTRTGLAMFTPEYASPEQVRSLPVSTATDVYSLGAVLYELATDRPPHRPTGGVLEIVRVICEIDPVRPSLAAPPERRRELAGDLDNIILKALHKEPAQRYASIEQFERDLAHYLDGLPVTARTATLGYRARKFIRRNKGAVLASALVVTTLISATVVSVRQARRADEQARRADESADGALAEKARAITEADRARKAERQVQSQLDEIKAAQTARVAAESQARVKTDEVAMTRDQLEVALQKARAEKELAEAESAKAREAEQRAARAAAIEKETREAAQALYEKEKAHVEQLESQGKKITTKLR